MCVLLFRNHARLQDSTVRGHGCGPPLGHVYMCVCVHIYIYIYTHTYTYKGQRELEPPPLRGNRARLRPRGGEPEMSIPS